MSTFDGALDQSGVFGVEMRADTKIGNFFWQAKLGRTFILRTLLLIVTWLVTVYMIVLPSYAASVAVPPTDIVTIGYVGDSITFGRGSGGFPSAVQTEQSLLGDNYYVVNAAVSGSGTNQWLPGSENFDQAVTEFQQQDVSVVSIMLGTNDVRNDQLTTDATYAANMRSIIDGLLATETVKTIIVNYPPYIVPGTLNKWSAESQSRLASYLPSIDALVNGSTVLQGDTESYSYFATHQDQLLDGIHPNAIGHAHLGALWAASYTRLAEAEESQDKPVVAELFSPVL